MRAWTGVDVVTDSSENRNVDVGVELKEDMKSYPFGFGRRVCPGQYMAHA